MGPETLFKIDGKHLEPGDISKGVAKTIELIDKDPTLSARLAGVAALARRQALEADNIDPNEKAYARTKLHDSLSRNLEILLHALEDTGNIGELSATLKVILDPAVEAEDAAGDRL